MNCAPLIVYIALLIAPSGNVHEVRVHSPEACVTVVQAYTSEVPGGRGTCAKAD